jgi:hypothetical protein
MYLFYQIQDKEFTAYTVVSVFISCDRSLDFAINREQGQPITKNFM